MRFHVEEKHLPFSELLLTFFLCFSLVLVNSFSTAGLQSLKSSESGTELTPSESDINSNCCVVAQALQDQNKGEPHEASPLNSNYENFSLGQSDNSSVNITKSNLFNANKTLEETAIVKNDNNDIFSRFSSRGKIPKPEILTSEDISVRGDWGGNCTAFHWKRCSKLNTWLGDYFENIKSPNKSHVLKSDFIDCKIQPNICMKNGWTVTRCQILCMGRCNRELQSKYDKYVHQDGMC